MTEHDRQPDDGPDDDPVVRLLEQCLLRLPAEGTAVVDELCRLHPEHAVALRDGLQFLQTTELVATPAEHLPERLGEYRLLQRLGGGGMGVVYLAEQQSLGRRVALKLIRPELLYFAGSRARFQREVDAIARLQHPNIVPVHASGEENGVPFFAMDYVEGASLAQLLAALSGGPGGERSGERLAAVLATCCATDGDAATFSGPWWQVAGRLVLQLADAVVHAHARGVLHRDLKPSNVMIDRHGRVQLVDFGLARAEGDVGVTATGAAVGSLAYMAPEQVEGGRPDPRTDVYGLGITLYELLTLHCPFLRETSAAVRRSIVEASTPPPRQLLGDLPQDLEIVCLQAMAPDRDRRYASAQAFRDDLDRALRHVPILARRAGWWARLRRYGRRQPARLSLAIALVLGLPTIVTLVALRYADRAAIDLGEVAEHERRVDDLLQRAWAGLAENPESSRRQFERLLQLDPDLPLAVVGLCVGTLNSRPLPELEKVLAAHREVVAAHPMFALLRSMASFDVHAPFPLPADAAIPATSLDWFLVGIAAMQRGDYGDEGGYERALTCFDQAIQLSTQQQLVIHLRRSMVLLTHGVFERMPAAAQVLATRWPDSAIALAYAGALLVDGEPERAERMLERALAIDDRLAFAWGQLGTMCMGRRDVEGYRDAMQRAVDCMPTTLDYRIELAKALLLCKQPEQALARIDEALEIRADVADVHDVRAETLAALARHDEALAAWGESERLAPQLPWPYFQRGRHLLRLQRFEEAAADLRRAIERGEFAIFHGVLAQACRSLDDFEGARAAAAEAERLEPGNAYWQLESAFATWKCGDVEAALRLFEQVVARMPADEQAHELRLRFARETGNAQLLADEERRWQQATKRER